tara:strand:- start:194 stop:535 length:342 start_codon:yes stop_codon:yes gene_type:complete
MREHTKNEPVPLGWNWENGSRVEMFDPANMRAARAVLVHPGRPFAYWVVSLGFKYRNERGQLRYVADRQDRYLDPREAHDLMVRHVYHDGPDDLTILIDDYNHTHTNENGGSK